MKSGYQVLPEFVIVQHERDRQILENFKTYFKCGYVKINNKDRLCYIVRKQAHLVNIIVPFFERHKLKTKKRIDFEKFRQIVYKMEKKEHLTDSGFKEIQKIIKDMRKYYRSPETEQRLHFAPPIPEGEGGQNHIEDKVQPLPPQGIGNRQVGCPPLVGKE